ncbi:MAG: hypothetical protein ACR2NZ_08525 [Rubripirellula sp.]
MANCDLSIELDQPDRVYLGGEMITGSVRVATDADVKCTGLEVSSGWRTHGRGNVDSGIGQTATLFVGEWKSGDQAEFRFELPVSHWPPSYHGRFLSIDHCVDARVKIPWGIDPKASIPFQMKPSCGAEGATVPSQVTEVKGILGCFVGVLVLGFLLIFLSTMAAAGPFALVFMILPLAAFVFWFFVKFLPKYALGDVRCELPFDSVSPGHPVSGELFICPRKPVSINAITANFQAIEQCVSGSGTDRTTHKHVLFENLESLQEAVTLNAGQEYRFPIETPLPEDAPYSIDLADNNLIWSATLRVDIPRWPDWVKEIPIRVVPLAESGGHEEIRDQSASRVNSAGAAFQTRNGPEIEEAAGAGGITFRETAEHLWSVRSDREQVATLVDAVTGLSFSIEAEIERRLLYGGDDDPHVYKDGYAVWARYPDPDLPMVLYVPHELADEFEQIGREVWRGNGTVVGWDRLHGRLQIKLDRPQSGGV